MADPTTSCKSMSRQSIHQCLPRLRCQEGTTVTALQDALQQGLAWKAESLSPAGMLRKSTSVKMCAGNSKLIPPYCSLFLQFNTARNFLLKQWKIHKKALPTLITDLASKWQGITWMHKVCPSFKLLLPSHLFQDAWHLYQ
jgi:hypothetical protein